MSNGIRFKNRLDAAKQLAVILQKFAKNEVVVFALPRGGVPMGKVISDALCCPLDIIIVRKIGHPTNSEYAIGVVSEDGNIVLNEKEIRSVSHEWFMAEVQKQQTEVKRRREIYLKDRAQIDPAGKVAIIVDDGIATGFTMRGAIEEIKRKKPAKIIVAVPVAPKETAKIIKQAVDEFIALVIPDNYLGAVGAYYDEFTQVSDEKAASLLKPK